MKTLLIASTNPGKMREIKEILSGLPFEIKSLADISYEGEIEETGNTFKENAVLKARAIGEKTGMLTLGEDSGLEVDALGGKPGIFSARYAEGSDPDRVNKLLKELKGVPKEKRTARFKTVVAIYDPQTKNIRTFDGISKGYIAGETIGENGFGYDPIFFNFDLGKTNAQATLTEKNLTSHRGRALLKVKKFLQNLH